MNSRAVRQAVVWGGGLIVFGALLLVEAVTDLSPWLWVLLLVVGALVATGIYYADRSDWAMLLTAYVLWAIVLLVALTTLDLLREEAVAFYVLIAIALPFLGVYYLNRALWWALIPAYVLIAVGVMVGLIGLGLLDDPLITTYVMFAIAIPFFVVYARDRKLWWALIPGGVLAVIGLAFLIAEAAFAYIGALVLLVVGVGILVGVFTRKEPAGEAGPPELEGEATTGPAPGRQDGGTEEESG